MLNGQITTHLKSIREANAIFIGYNVAVALKGGGGGVIGLSFAWYVPLASQSPYPIIVYSVSNYRPHISHFLGTCNFCDPNFVTFNFCVYLILNEE